MSAVHIVAALPRRLHRQEELQDLDGCGPWLCESPPSRLWLAGALVVSVAIVLATGTVRGCIAATVVLLLSIWGTWIRQQEYQRRKVCPECLRDVSRDARRCCWCGYFA